MAKSASAAAPALTPHPAPGYPAPRVSPIAPACARPPTRSNSRTPSSCSPRGSDVPPPRRARAQRTPAGSAPQARRQCRSGDRGAAYRALRLLQPMSHQNALRSKMTLPCVTFPSRPMRFHLRAHLCAPRARLCAFAAATPAQTRPSPLCARPAPRGGRGGEGAAVAAARVGRSTALRGCESKVACARVSCGGGAGSRRGGGGGDGQRTAHLTHLPTPLCARRRRAPDARPGRDVWLRH